MGANVLFFLLSDDTFIYSRGVQALYSVGRIQDLTFFTFVIHCGGGCERIIYLFHNFSWETRRWVFGVVGGGGFGKYDSVSKNDVGVIKCEF